MATSQAPLSPAAAAAPRPRVWTLPGLCGEARVMTSFGELPVKALRLRDPVRTIGGNFLPVKWVDQVHLDDGFLSGFPDAQPIHIWAGSLGRERPKCELLVSPQQQVAVGDGAFRPDYRLARDLLGRPGVVRRPQATVSYYLFHVGEPTSVLVEGLWVPVSP
ncbi:MAG: Hint domain-containing protein [Paracoccaceae bacterium]